MIFRRIWPPHLQNPGGQASGEQDPGGRGSDRANPPTPEHEDPTLIELRSAQFNFATAYKDGLSEVLWQDEHGSHYTILSNIDFRWLQPLTEFTDPEDPASTWLFFTPIMEVDVPSSESFPELKAELEQLLQDSRPDYLLLMAQDQKTEPPVELLTQLDTLHRYVAEHHAQLAADHQRQRLLQEARQAQQSLVDLEKPRDTIINFWRVQ